MVRNNSIDILHSVIDSSSTPELIELFNLLSPRIKNQAINEERSEVDKAFEASKNRIILHFGTLFETLTKVMLDQVRAFKPTYKILAIKYLRENIFQCDLKQAKDVVEYIWENNL
jgi:ribosomal protein L7/L12